MRDTSTVGYGDNDLINIDHQTKFNSLASSIMDTERQYVEEAAQDYAAIVFFGERSQRGILQR